MMRQAGRYQKAYRDLAAKHPSFRERSEVTDLIVEISLQPWNSFKPDGVIIFRLGAARAGAGVGAGRVGEAWRWVGPGRVGGSLVCVCVCGDDEEGLGSGAKHMTKPPPMPHLWLCDRCS